MKAETYMISREGGIGYGYQLTSDNGDFIMDMVLGHSSMPLMSARKDIENEFVKHRPLITMMAEAPTLLAALEEAMVIADTWWDENTSYCDCIEAMQTVMRKAIARAKGEKQDE